MAFWKRRSRGSFAPAANDRFAAVYLGRRPVADGAGLDGASPALDGLYRAYKDDKGTSAQRVTVEVIVSGLVVNRIKGFSAPPAPSADSSPVVAETNRVLLAAAQMHFGATDPARPRVFFVVKRIATGGVEEPGSQPQTTRSECHAFLCDSPANARTLTLQLVEMFDSIGGGDAAIRLAYRRSAEYAYPSHNHQQQQQQQQNQQQQQQHQARLDKGLLRSQSLNLPRSMMASRGRPLEAVSALKITMNVDPHSSSPAVSSDSSSSSSTPAGEANNNSEIARLFVERELSEQRAAATVQRESGPRAATTGNTNGSGAVSLVASPAEESGSGPGGAALPGAGDTAFHPGQGNSPQDKPPPMRTKSAQQQQKSQLASVKEQHSPCPSPKPSPKERKMMTKEETKENRRMAATDSEAMDRANKRKSVRFADDAEII